MFFDFVDGGYTTRDDEGHECDGLDAVRMELLQALPEVLLGDVQDRAERYVACTIRNERGAVLYRASVTLTVQGSPDV